MAESEALFDAAGDGVMVQALLDRLQCQVIKASRAEFVVRLSSGEEAIDDDYQDGMTEYTQCAFLVPAGGDPQVLDRQVGQRLLPRGYQFKTRPFGHASKATHGP